LAASTFNVTVNYISPSVRTCSTDMRREWSEDAVTVIRNIAAGQSFAGASMVVTDGATVATGTVTWTGGATAADTVTVSGQAFTCVASGATNNQFNVQATATLQATELARAINASTTAAFKGKVFATSSAGVVTITAAAPGPLGNLVTLAKSAANAAVSGATLTGGASNAPVNLLF
jgi:hypothetical protein